MGRLESTRFRMVYEHPVLTIGAVDAASWLCGLSVGSLLRFDLDAGMVSWRGVLGFGALALLLTGTIGVVIGTWRRRWRIASFEEFRNTAVATGFITLGLMALALFFENRTVPLGALAAGGAFALLGQLGVRSAWRVAVERALLPPVSSRPLLVFGAGEAGDQIVTSLLRTPDGVFRPIAILDDSHARRSIRGIPVVGGRGELSSVAAEFQARDLLIAIPSIAPRDLRSIVSEATSANLRIYTLPKVDQLIDASVSVDDVRELSEADLLERGELDTNVSEVAAYLAGKVVLVTGAGGSIGSEICRQIDRFGVDRVIMLDRDENGLHATQLSIAGHGLLQNADLVVADIRDSERILEVFERTRPDVVYHTAALKHLPLLELHPDEAFKTNVQGTSNVLAAARAVGVSRFVNVSTDKAADPTCVLGRSKRLAERLTAEAAEPCVNFMSVRFGNVLGSAGSVLPTFRRQIAAGGPVTVTHPDVTRYFMTIPEAVELVIQAGAIGSGGEVMVLDMGEPVRILDMARRLIAHSNRADEIEIVFTGLRPGEKLDEVLFSQSEELGPTSHPLIRSADVEPVRLETLDPGDVLGERAGS